MIWHMKYNVYIYTHNRYTQIYLYKNASNYHGDIIIRAFENQFQHQGPRTPKAWELSVLSMINNQPTGGQHFCLLLAKD